MISAVDGLQRQSIRSGRMIFSLAVLCLLTAPPAWAQTEAELRQQFSDAGLMVVGSRASLLAESDLTKDLKEATRLRKDVVTATRNHATLHGQMTRLQETLTALQAQYGQLNVQLANVRDTFSNNRLVGAINAVQAQMELLQTQKKQVEEQESEAQAKLSDARDAFLALVLKMREKADQLEASYDVVPEETGDLLRKFNQVTGTEVKYGPSGIFAQNEKRLADFEKSVLSEAIPLRNESRTLWVDVTVNDKQRKEFVVDSGANLVTMPIAMAKELGLEPKPDDPVIMLSLANGSIVEGHQILIPELRVGKFIVNDVECAVLGPDAPNAPPLLGMAFLGNFKFEINTATSTLIMMQIETPETKSSSRRKRP